MQLRLTTFIGSFVALSFSLILTNRSALAQVESRRGFITSSRCPFTCKDAAVPESDCRESRRGDICDVEDLRQPPGHRTVFRTRVPIVKAPSVDANEVDSQPSFQDRSQEIDASKTATRGLITSGACPLDCKSINIPQEYCREWRTGDRCYVEDLSQAAGHRTLFKK